MYLIGIGECAITRRFACSFVLSLSCAACCSFAEEAPRLSFCVVQTPSGGSYAQNTGKDARELTNELSQRKRDGHSVTAVSLVRDAKSTNAAIKRIGCSYVIVLERHEAVDESSLPDGVGAMRDSDVIVYSLRAHDSRKNYPQWCGTSNDVSRTFRTAGIRPISDDCGCGAEDSLEAADSQSGTKMSYGHKQNRKEFHPLHFCRVTG